MRVLVPMDGSGQSWKAFEHAAERFPDATLVVLRVIDPVQAGYGIGLNGAGAGQWFDAQEEATENLFEEVRKDAESAGIDVETRKEVGRPTREITDAAADCDQVVIGSHGREGVSRILLGSVAENVVRRSPVPVTVVR
ncbi:universal stress protein [Natronomonas amylolytica]|uniref:universal stress protein n=1 Tax=Natronomonas amylolytica TaxID=3108498 RepID=UPI0030083BAB